MFGIFNYEEIPYDEKISKWQIKPKTISESDNGRIISRIGYDKTDCFALEEIEADGKMTIEGREEFFGMYVMEGNGTLLWSEGSMNIDKGDQIFVPRSLGGLDIIPSENSNLDILRFFGPKQN